MLLGAQEFCQFARTLSEEARKSWHFMNQAYQEVSTLDPLPAVIECARKARAMTPEQATKLSALTSGNFADLVKQDDPVVMAAHEMKNVPEGAVIAIIHVVPTEVLGPAGGRTPFLKFPKRGQRHLIHVMVSLGNGFAAGTKGRNIGLPVTTDNWEKVNLADSLHWHKFSDSYDAITESLGSGSPRHLRIRYRRLEDIQKDGPSQSQETIDPSAGHNLVSLGVLQQYDRNSEGWWLYRIGDDANPPFEGWKLHVSCDVNNAAQILDLVLPRLRQSNVAHKFLLTREEVEEQNADAQQKGKVLVIYPEDILDAFTLVNLVDVALQKHVSRSDSPVVQNEIAVGNTVVYTRYGAFTSKWILDSDRGKFVPDPKGVPYPDWIQNPWTNKYPDQTGLDAIAPWPIYTKKQKIWLASNGERPPVKATSNDDDDS